MASLYFFPPCSLPSGNSDYRPLVCGLFCSLRTQFCSPPLLFPSRSFAADHRVGQPRDLIPLGTLPTRLHPPFNPFLLCSPPCRYTLLPRRDCPNILLYLFFYMYRHQRLPPRKNLCVKEFPALTFFFKSLIDLPWWPISGFTSSSIVRCKPDSLTNF